jgi:hypothetical protein
LGAFWLLSFCIRARIKEMKFLAQFKERKSHLTASNDEQVTIKLITNEAPIELFSLPSDRNYIIEITEE